MNSPYHKAHCSLWETSFVLCGKSFSYFEALFLWQVAIRNSRAGLKICVKMILAGKNKKAKSSVSQDCLFRLAVFKHGSCAGENEL